MFENLKGYNDGKNVLAVYQQEGKQRNPINKPNHLSSKTKVDPGGSSGQCPAVQSDRNGQGQCLGAV